jgi:hypothetical protein
MGSIFVSPPHPAKTDLIGKRKPMTQAYSRIFLLSHMRAYTSLLGHILGSHPQINGYYEMHLSYETANDLDRQIRQYTQHETLKPNRHFLFDKLLHNDYDLNLQQLNLQNEIILLALRQPEQTIKSIINLFAKKNTDDLYSYPAEATKYYIERLQKLTAFAQQYPQHYYYFDAELVRSDTRRILTAFEEWLRLDSPLSAQYQQFTKTGIAGAGDTSAAITGGKVIREASQYDTPLDTDLLQQATQAYQHCRQQLIGNALAAITA